MRNRRLKVQADIKNTRYMSHYTRVPKILLRGEWLAEAGFLYNQHVIVKVENERLIIEAE